MNKKQAKRQRDLKNKLMAAICMLLVSSIMMVSTTYAWFTLSTAPEVTGINTAVGANGNLEMALLPTSGAVADITSAVGDSMNSSTTTIQQSNNSWGNLVSLSDNTIYGTDKFVLYPSTLNLDQGGKIPTTGSILQTPVYGADGRVVDLEDKTSTAIYGVNGFVPGDTVSYGVRAVGVDSGMTPRELDYRNARAAANSAMNLAATKATQSLASNGSSLATIAVNKGIGNTEFPYDDVKYLGLILDELQGTDGILEQIEYAYLQYILAFAASKSVSDDNAYTTIKGWVEADDATLNGVISQITNGATTLGSTITLPKQFTDGVDAYNITVAAVETARTNYNALNVTEGGTYQWTTVTADGSVTTPGIDRVVNALADSSRMTVNGMTVPEVKENMQALVDAVTNGTGITVEVASGAGVYADIADQCGDYKAQVKLNNISYGGLTVNATAWMNTKSDVVPSYLSQLGTTVGGLGTPEAGTGDAMPLSDMYGYIIDLAFKTNAAESDLLLQQTGVDRIYDDQSGTETMGNGSTMTFQATTTDLTEQQIKDLMGAIRIIFFDPDTGVVKANAKLNAANATLGTNGYTAQLYLYTVAEAGEPTYQQENYDAASGKTYYTAKTDYVYTAVAAEDLTTERTDLYTKNAETGEYSSATYTDGSAETYYTRSDEQVTTYTAVSAEQAAAAQPNTLYVQVEATAGQEIVKTDNIIMPLNQNAGTKLSVLVYLEGEVVTNGSVAATGSTSMTGTMNLQFASSANLTPMEYKDLHQGTIAASYKVTVPTGVTGAATATAGRDYTFTVATGYTLSSITIGGTAMGTLPTPDAAGKYMIPADSVTGDIVIAVTAPTNP